MFSSKILVCLCTICNIDATSLIVGGQTITYDVTRDGVKGATSNVTNEDKLYAALGKLGNQMNDSSTYLVPSQIIQATSQLVAGTKYTWAVLLSASGCPKTRELNKSCTTSKTARRELYLVSFFDAVTGLTKTYNLERLDNREPVRAAHETKTTVKSDPKEKEGIPGGEVESSDLFEKELFFAISKLGSRMGKTYLVPVKINKATKQVVAGYIYRWELFMTDSGCKVGTTVTKKDCPPLRNAVKNAKSYKIMYFAAVGGRKDEFELIKL